MRTQEFEKNVLKDGIVLEDARFIMQSLNHKVFFE